MESLVYQKVKEFKNKYPMTISWRLKKHAKVVEEHLNSDEKVLYALKKRVDIYDTFIDGTKESFDMTLKVFPNLLAMVFGVNIFLKSGVLDFIFNNLKPIFSYINVQIEILPMAIMRPISGSASLAILNDIFLNYGPDSFIGTVASIIQ